MGVERRFIEVQSTPRKVVIDLDKVKYIQKRGKKCVFHKVDGERVCYESLQKIYTRLCKETFFISKGDCIMHK